MGTPRRPRPLPEGSAQILRAALKSARTKGQYQQVLCLWMREVLQLTSDAIGLTLGLAGGSVRRIQSRFLHEGAAMFTRPGKGGRHRQNLTVTAEREFLEGLLRQTRPANAVLEARFIHEAYERKVGHPVPSSVVYRMLRRHRWRRLSVGPVATAQGWAEASLYDDAPAPKPE